MKFYMQVPIEIGNVEALFDVEYTYTPGTPAVMYQRNGDPGWPAEGPEIEIYDIKVGDDKVPDWMYDALLDTVTDWVQDNHAEGSE